MPDEPVHLTQGDPALGSGVVEQAQVYRVGDLREQGEIGPLFLPGNAQRPRIPRPDTHLSSPAQSRLFSP